MWVGAVPRADRRRWLPSAKMRTERRMPFRRPLHKKVCEMAEAVRTSSLGVDLCTLLACVAPRLEHCHNELTVAQRKQV